MFSVKLVKRDTQEVVVRLIGSLDETVRFDALIGPSAPKMIVYGDGVTRINSIGVKMWITYFDKAQKNGTVLEFHECSPVVVEQFNYYKSFSCGGTLVSLHVPFLCSKCDSEFSQIMLSTELKKLNFNITAATCPKCQGQGMFDDDPRDFFAYLMSGGV